MSEREKEMKLVVALPVGIKDSFQHQKCIPCPDEK